MPRITLVFAALLILLGVGFYVGTDMEHPTSLIPAGFGLVLGICGAVAIARPQWRKHVMHVAVAVALLGVLGTLRSVPGAIALATGGEVERPSAVTAQAIMLLLCVVYVVLGGKSFIDARRNRLAGGER